MHETMKSKVRDGLLGIMLVMLAASTSAAQTTAAAQKGKPAPYVPVPLVATFQLPTPPSNVMCDWADSSGYPLTGDACYSGTFLTGASTTVEGAFINSLGGIDINLVSGARQMVFQFDTPVGVQASTPCFLPASVAIPADVVDFRFNATQYSNGVEGMHVGEELTVFGGSINFTPIADFTSLGTQQLTNVFLRYGSTFSGTKTLTRTAFDSWRLAFDGWVQLQCTTKSGRGKTTQTEIGTFYMPFVMDVVKR